MTIYDILFFHTYMKSVLYISYRDVLTDHKIDVCYDAGIKSTLCRTCFKFIGRNLDSMCA